MHSLHPYGIVAATSALICAAPAWGQNSFSGTYSGKSEDVTYTLKLQQGSDGSVTGSLMADGSVMELKGKAAGDGKRVTGKLVLNGQEIPIEFEVRREGERFRFSMKADDEEDVIYFTREGKAATNEPAKPEPKPAKPANAVPKPPAKAAPLSAAIAPATGNAYKHPSGIRMKLPAGWKIIQPGIAPVLLPPGATKPDGDELYMLLIGDASRMESKDDPRLLAQFVEQLLSSKEGLFGGNLRFEQVTGGSGLTFTATTPQGQTVYARCFFSQPKGVIAATLAVGVKERIQPREKALQSAIASVTIGQMEQDARLVGNWNGKATPNSVDARDATGRLQASSVSDSSITYRIGSDGTFVEEKHSRTIAIGQGVSLDGGDQVERTTGRWCASDGTVAILGPTGLFVTGTYRLEGGRPILKLAGQTIVLGQ